MLARTAGLPARAPRQRLARRGSRLSSAAAAASSAPQAHLPSRRAAVLGPALCLWASPSWAGGYGRYVRKARAANPQSSAAALAAAAAEASRLAEAVAAPGADADIDVKEWRALLRAGPYARFRDDARVVAYYAQQELGAQGASADAAIDALAALDEALRRAEVGEAEVLETVPRLCEDVAAAASSLVALVPGASASPPSPAAVTEDDLAQLSKLL